MAAIWSQQFPPKPTFTEKECENLDGKVFIVTGGASGVGRELANILYGKNGTVYIAARSEAKAKETITWCQSQFPSSDGKLHFLHLDLGDLVQVDEAAKDFTRRETRLDVLWNNAGVMVPPEGSTTKQGYELQLGTNCIGPFLFTQKLQPILAKTASLNPPGSVRVAWAGSVVIDMLAPSGGIDMENITWKKSKGSNIDKYAQSKVGNMFLASEFAKRDRSQGIMHIAFNPGNLKSPLQRHASKIARFLTSWTLHHPKMGAYTELFAGLSPTLAFGHTGSYIIPWGRVYEPRQDLLKSMKGQGEGGSGVAAAFWDWCDSEAANHL